MKRIRKLTTAFLVIALLVTSLVSVPAFADEPTTVTRIGGDNRYLTAIEVSKKAYEDGAKVVIIASGEEWPDALAGSALAAVKEAPILLAKKDMIHDYTIEEIERLEAKKAIILGGPEAIGAPVEDALKAMDDLTVYRIGGSNRFETATLIAGQLGNVSTEGAHVYLASSEDYADALAIGPLAYVDKAPVLLTKADKLNATTKAYLASLGEVTVTIVGGVDAISKAVADEVDDIEGVSVEEDRLAGENRWETSVKIAEKFIAEKFTDATQATQIVVALGNNFPDALVGGYYAGSIKAPIVLVKGDSISGSVDGFVWASDRQGYHKWIIGGKDAIKPVVETDLKNIGKILAGFTVEAVTDMVPVNVETQLEYTINGRASDLYETHNTTFLYNKANIDATTAGKVNYPVAKMETEGKTTFKYQVKVTAGELTGQSAMQEVTVYDAAKVVSVEVTLPEEPIYLSAVGTTSSVAFLFEAKNAAGNDLTTPDVVGTPTTTGKAKAVGSGTNWILQATEAGKSKITFKFGDELTADIDVEVLADPVATTVETTDKYKAKVEVDDTNAYVLGDKYEVLDQYGNPMDTSSDVSFKIYNANDVLVSGNILKDAGKYTVKIWNKADKLIGSFPVEAVKTADAEPDEIKIVFTAEFENTLIFGGEATFTIKAFYDGFELAGAVTGYKVYSSDEEVVSVDTANSKIEGEKHGTATLRLVKMEGDFEGETVYTVDIVVADPQVTAINFVAPYDKVYFTGTVTAENVAACTDVLADYIESVQFVAATKVVVVKIAAANGGQVFTLPAVDHAFLNGD